MPPDMPNPVRVLQRELREGVDVKPDLKTLGVPWYYRCSITNWLMAQPWRWHYRSMYRAFRQPPVDNVKDGGQGRIRATWSALTFPHVHHPAEDA